MFLGSWKGLVSRPEFGSHTSSKTCPVHSFQRVLIKSFLPPTEIQPLRILSISVLCALSYYGSQSAHQQRTRASGSWHLFGTLKLMTHPRLLDGESDTSGCWTEVLGWHWPVWVAVKLPVCRALCVLCAQSEIFFPGKLTLPWSLLLIEISQNFLRASKGGSKMRVCLKEVSRTEKRTSP